MKYSILFTLLSFSIMTQVNSAVTTGVKSLNERTANLSNENSEPIESQEKSASSAETEEIFINEFSLEPKFNFGRSINPSKIQKLQSKSTPKLIELLRKVAKKVGREIMTDICQSYFKPKTTSILISSSSNKIDNV